MLCRQLDQLEASVEADRADLRLRYGSSCNLVLSTGQGVNGFTLDEASPNTLKPSR